MAELVEFKLHGGKPKTVCMVMNISTVVTTIEQDLDQSLQTLTTELNISWESSTCATPLHSLTTRKNSCSVEVSTTCVTKTNVSQLLLDILRLSYSCSIGNEPQNTLFFFDSMHCVCAHTVRRHSNLASPFVLSIHNPST